MATEELFAEQFSRLLGVLLAEHGAAGTWPLQACPWLPQFVARCLDAGAADAGNDHASQSALVRDAAPAGPR